MLGLNSNFAHALYRGGNQSIFAKLYMECQYIDPIPNLNVKRYYDEINRLSPHQTNKSGNGKITDFCQNWVGLLTHWYN